MEQFMAENAKGELSCFLFSEFPDSKVVLILTISIVYACYPLTPIFPILTKIRTILQKHCGKDDWITLNLLYVED